MNTKSVILFLLATQAAAAGSFKTNTIMQNGKVVTTSVYDGTFEESTVVEGNEAVTTLKNLKQNKSFAITPTTIVTDNHKRVVDPCSGKKFRIPKPYTYSQQARNQQHIPKLATDMILKVGQSYSLKPAESSVLFPAACGGKIKIIKPIQFSVKKEVRFENLLIDSKCRLIDRSNGAIILKLRKDECLHIPNGSFETRPVRSVSVSPR